MNMVLPDGGVDPVVDTATSGPSELGALSVDERAASPSTEWHYVPVPSSGSRSARSSIDPLRSAKSTVTFLRSPSSALREVRIYADRCLGA
jgi:hypothetical protein